MIEGSLDSVPLSDVFQVIVTGQKSGVLTVIHRTNRARLHFDEGRIEYAHLSPGVHLGEILVRMELLTTHEVQEILLRQTTEEGGPPLGRLAVDLEFLAEEDLERALERQAIEVLTELMLWEQGTFSFAERSDATTGFPTAQAIDAMALLMTVAQRLDDYQSGAVAPEAVFDRTGDPTQVAMPQGGWEVLGYVDGRRTARGIAAELDLAERQVYHLLFTLARLGVITPSPFAIEEPLVLVISPSSVLQRLIRLALQRARLQVEVVANPEIGMDTLATLRPSAVVVDDNHGEAWEFVRELRKRAGLSHLPVVVLGSEDPSRTLFGRFRRPKATFMKKPFHELDFQQLITRLVGRSIA